MVNYEETARLATEAFASLNRVIMPERLRWFYERCFSLGATVIALRNGDRKVGQIAMVRQTLRLNGQEPNCRSTRRSQHPSASVSATEAVPFR